MHKIEDMWTTPGPRPNGLQASGEGLWVIDAGNNHVYLLDYETGQPYVDVETETYKSSGITLIREELWVSSTHNSRIYRLEKDGSTIEYFEPPGLNDVDPRDSGPDYIRPHGLEWMNNSTVWVSVKPALRNYLFDISTRRIIKSIPTPGVAPHGLAWDGEGLWCADRASGIIHKLEPDSGVVMDEIKVKEPELHGLTFHENYLWFCCDPSRRVCRIQLD